MKFILIFFVLIIYINFSVCDDLQVGVSVGNQIAYTENVKLASVPFKTRTKNVFYSSPTNQVIKGISVIDLDQSKGKAIVTSGGVGSTFTNVKIKGEKGEGLNYQVQIFA